MKILPKDKWSGIKFTKIGGDIIYQFINANLIRVVNYHKMLIHYPQLKYTYKGDTNDKIISNFESKFWIEVL